MQRDIVAPRAVGCRVRLPSEVLATLDVGAQPGEALTAAPEPGMVRGSQRLACAVIAAGPTGAAVVRWLADVTCTSRSPRSYEARGLARGLLRARMFDRTPLLLSLVTLTLACGPLEADSTTGSSSGSGPTTGGVTETSGATDVTPTTGEPEFPACQDPLARDDVGFVFSSATLNDFDPIDVMCQVDGASNDDPSVSAAIDLTCTDADAVSHAVRIELKLFAGAAPLAVLADAPQVRLVHYKVDDFTYREVLALRGPGDQMLLYAGSGYEVLNADDAALRAPLTVVAATEELCILEVLEECYQQRRMALDISAADVDQRVFDRNQATLSGFEVHVGKAVDIDRYAGDTCAGDSVDGPRAQPRHVRVRVSRPLSTAFRSARRGSPAATRRASRPRSARRRAATTRPRAPSALPAGLA